MTEILTVREVEDLLTINEKTAYKLAAKGEIMGFKEGGSWRFDRAALGSLLRGNQHILNVAGDRVRYICVGLMARSSSKLITKHCIKSRAHHQLSPLQG